PQLRLGHSKMIAGDHIENGYQASRRREVSFIHHTEITGAATKDPPGSVRGPSVRHEDVELLVHVDPARLPIANGDPRDAATWWRHRRIGVEWAASASPRSVPASGPSSCAT